MTFASVLAWIIIGVLCLVALFILGVICVFIYKCFQSVLRRLEIFSSKEA